MASNLNEFYKSQNKALPTVAERQGVAKEAGISNYTGTADQNVSLLGYLTKTPSYGNENVITPESLATEKKINVKEPVQDTSGTGMITTVGSLAESTRKEVEADQKLIDKESTGYAQALKDFGDQGAFKEQTYKDQGVDTSKKVRDNFLSQIEAEQESVLNRIEEVRKSAGGLTAGANAEIARIQRDSANKLAKLGIGLSSASRNYESASNIATRLIEDNSSKLKSDIESRKFVLDQLGTKLATNKSNALTLTLKQMDNETSLINKALEVGKNLAESGAIDSTTYSEAISELASGKISRADFFDKIGSSEGDEVGIINGYDINDYATDPTHEQKVTSIYETIGDISDDKSADAVIKALSPNSPITGKMVTDSASKYGVDPKLMIAIMQQDSTLGTAGKAVRTKNAGNYGNDDAGNEVTFKNWGDGVDAVAKWLSGHKATKRYTGEFQSTLETVANATGEAMIAKNKNLSLMKKSIAEGDYKSAYTQIVNSVKKSLTGTEKTDFTNKYSSLNAIKQLEDKLKAYNDGGGKTGIIKGTYEDVVNKLGLVSDPKYKTLATDLKIALQEYRQVMTGSAFSDQEARDYASVNPTGKNSMDLNLSILDGLYANRKRYTENIVDSIAGDGAKYIREYAEAGTTPASKTKVAPISTPAGNSFTIISE